MSGETQTIVIDNGSGYIKTSFAGQDNSPTVFPNYVGRPKYERIMASVNSGDECVGRSADGLLKGVLKLKYPMEHGIVCPDSWHDMELVWAQVFKELGVPPDQHPVLLTEAPLNPRSHRAKAAEVFFETLGVPSINFQEQAVLSLYAAGKTTGVVLDSGDGVTHVVPIYEGFSLRHAVGRMDLAGRDVTGYLQQLLRIAGYNFQTSVEMQTVRQIKEKLCCVQLPQKERRGQSSLEQKQMDEDTQPEYSLPDGSTISIGQERVKAPEVMFDPSLIGLEHQGVHQMLAESIMKCDMDIRRTLFYNIFLAGGNTMMDGFAYRITNETKELTPREAKVKIHAPKNRHLTCWLGGSILASLATFQRLLITKKQYEEDKDLFRRM